MKKKIVFIGNSIVNGFPFPRAKSFTGIMRKRLRNPDDIVSAGFAVKGIELEIINKGVNGETTVDLMKRFTMDVVDLDPDYVFIASGTNDFMYRDRLPKEAFDVMEVMASMAESSPKGAKVVYITPLNVDEIKAERMWLVGCGIKYDVVNDQVAEYSEMIRTCGRPYFDMNREYEGFAKYIDGLHPTAEGYELIADRLLHWMLANID